MSNNYAIRNKRNGELIATYDNPITAELERRAKEHPDDYEIAERRIENIYKTFPDGKVYITGTDIKWEKYEDQI